MDNSEVLENDNQVLVSKRVESDKQVKQVESVESVYHGESGESGEQGNNDKHVINGQVSKRGLVISEKSLLNTRRKKDIDKVAEVLDGGSSAREDVRLEARRLAIEKGLTVESVVDKYKDIINTPDVKYKGSDVLKAIERIEKIHGLNDEESFHKSADKLAVMLQDRDISEIQVMFLQITKTTERYLKVLQGDE